MAGCFGRSPRSSHERFRSLATNFHNQYWHGHALEPHISFLQLTRSKYISGYRMLNWLGRTVPGLPDHTHWKVDVSIVCATAALLGPDLFIAMSTQGYVISLSPESYSPLMSLQRILGAEGECFAWDSRATGYGRGEGVASLVLKSLDAAIRDGDHIHAVIREAALNQDGRKTTITTPSMEAQEKLIKMYKRAGLDISQTGYVEAHMTG